MTTNELDAANILRRIPEIEAAKLAAQGLRFMRKDKEAPLEVARRQARTAETVVDARIVGMRKAKIEVEPVIAQAREAHAAMVTHGREVDEARKHVHTMSSTLSMAKKEKENTGVALAQAVSDLKIRQHAYDEFRHEMQSERDDGIILDGVHAPRASMQWAKRKRPTRAVDSSGVKATKVRSGVSAGGLCGDRISADTSGSAETSRVPGEVATETTIAKESLIAGRKAAERARHNDKCAAARLTRAEFNVVEARVSAERAAEIMVTREAMAKQRQATWMFVESTVLTPTIEAYEAANARHKASLATVAQAERDLMEANGVVIPMYSEKRPVTRRRDQPCEQLVGPRRPYVDPDDPSNIVLPVLKGIDTLSPSDAIKYVLKANADKDKAEGTKKTARTKAKKKARTIAKKAAIAAKRKQQKARAVVSPNRAVEVGMDKGTVAGGEAATGTVVGGVAAAGVLGGGGEAVPQCSRKSGRSSSRTEAKNLWMEQNG